ncbi:pyridoxamine 5'-phosphate oxidase-domain-containing protein [Podospora didyma]|uniref:Pyridoxamine 5'-phosphate oxidase-domain-containing protein n=1 Tax=Podospora didyma TaxID=330526 RepID=A0AAE0U6W6_9PEZI|nr:pyridoxamine 5'-phosphate oxidase-domain-containing protein [Podospora didyma]
MKAASILALCTSAVAAVISSPSDGNSQNLPRVPTSYESAVMGRRILALTPLGTIATVFPYDEKKSTNDGADAQENRPAGLGGMPSGLMEYIADCEGEAGIDDIGNPTILALNIEINFKNAAAGSNVSLAVQWTPPHPPAKQIKSTVMGRILSSLGFGDDKDDQASTAAAAALPYSAANLPRFSLLGHIERIEGGDDRTSDVGAKLASCFVKTHPDARYWLPGNRIHESHFVRLVVEQVYWIGGFGDRAYIGWIPVEEWNNVRRAEWESITLPGEKKGWKEWSVQEDL